MAQWPHSPGWASLPEKCWKSERFSTCTQVQSQFSGSSCIEKWSVRTVWRWYLVLWSEISPGVWNVGLVFGILTTKTFMVGLLPKTIPLFLKALLVLLPLCRTLGHISQRSYIRRSIEGHDGMRMALRCLLTQTILGFSDNPKNSWWNLAAKKFFLH